MYKHNIVTGKPPEDVDMPNFTKRDRINWKAQLWNLRKILGLLSLLYPVEAFVPTSRLYSKRFNGNLIVARSNAVENNNLAQAALSRQNNIARQNLKNPNENKNDTSKNKGGNKRGYRGQKLNNNNQQRKGPSFTEAKALNQKLLNAESSRVLLDVFLSKGGARGMAGGGVISSVNYSTALHRLARFASYIDYSKINNQSKQQMKSRKGVNRLEEQRRQVLADPRFAIFIASLCEALAGVEPYTNEQQRTDVLLFQSRELSNIAWAVAKLKVAAPSYACPIIRSDSCKDQSEIKEEKSICESKIEFSSINEMEDDLISTAKKVRMLVLEVAKQRQGSTLDKSVKVISWIPTLSELSAKLLDYIACQSLDVTDDFNPQEIANLLWAFSTAGRADKKLFDVLGNQLVSLKERVNQTNKNGDIIRQPYPQEYSNSIWAFASAGISGSSQRNLIRFTADTLDENNGEIVSRFKPQELSNTAWGIATILSKREGARLNSHQHDRSILSIENEELSEDDAVLRISRWVAKSLQQRVNDFKPQEVSNTIWAFATIGFGVAPNSVYFNSKSDNIFLRSTKIKEDRELVSKTLDIVARNTVYRLSKFRPQELNNLAWGFARLGHYGSDSFNKLFQGIGIELKKRPKRFAAQDICTAMWSFASVEYFDEEVFRTAASELSSRDASSFKPQEMSNTIWALATSGATPKYLHAFDYSTQEFKVRKNTKPLDPITQCFANTAIELIDRPFDFKEQEIKDVLWSLSKVGIRHPLLFKKVAEHLVGKNSNGISRIKAARGLDGFSSQGLGNLAWSYAKQAQLIETAPRNISENSGRLAVYEASCRDIGESLIKRLFLSIAETAINRQSYLTKFKPQDLSNTCWAFATLGMFHREFFELVSSEVRKRLLVLSNPTEETDANLSTVDTTLFRSQEIANLAWSFATLNFCPDGFMDLISSYIIPKFSKDMRYLKQQEAANIAWSCAVFGQYPKDLMPLLYCALLGNTESDDCETLTKAYGGEYLHMQSIMSLLYVQLALDLEAPQLGLSLPENFPTNWLRCNDLCNTNGIDDAVMDSKSYTSPMLSLHPSRLQNDVSQALLRLSFKHKQEYVIGTKDIQQSRGINLSSEHIDFLSIDIADAENLTGIEVDGPGHFINILDDFEKSIPGESSTNIDENMIPQTSKKCGWIFKSSTLKQVNGPTALKHKILSSIGWRLLHVPYWEWRDVSGNKENEEAYCKQLLENA